jgi:hypothetical protein
MKPHTRHLTFAIFIGVVLLIIATVVASSFG